MKQIALVLVGMPGAGKSVASDYLIKKGFKYLRFGQVTIDELERRNLPINEANERVVREELRQQLGMDAYAQMLWPLIESGLAENPLVLDGMYSWAEYKFLRQKLVAGMTVVAVTAPRSLRYARLATRQVRPLTADEAEQRDIAEIENLQKGGPIAVADFTLVNGGTLDDLEPQINAVLIAIGYS